MIDIVVEVIRSVVMAGIFVLLILSGRKYLLTGQRGWELILLGFGLLLFGSLLDITDNFDSLNRFVVVGDTPMQALLEKVVGYLLGFILLFSGFSLWLPIVAGRQPSVKYGRHSSLPVVIVAVLGISVSGLMFFLADSNYHEHAQSEFVQNSAQYAAVAEGRIGRSAEVVGSLEDFFNSSNIVDRGEFRSFANGGLARNSSVQALEWVPRVPAAQRAAYEAAARTDGFEDFQFLQRSSDGTMAPAAAREEYFPVYFVEPHAGNEAALGFDLASNSERLDAIERARDSGRPVATKRIRLVQETGDQFGFLLFMPVYETKSVPATLAERSSPVMKSLSDQSVSGATMMTSIAGLPSMFATMAIARAVSN